jgi:tetratricopeptide (TPR) repeat protein
VKPGFLYSPRTLACFVALVATAVYVNALGNGFALDDVFIIEQNSRAHDPTDLRATLLTPYWSFRGAELGLYRPGAIFLFAVQWAAGNGAPWVFHAVSIALHALATSLVFMFLTRFTERVPALVGALIFAVHPVHVEAVANIVGQAEIMAALLVLAGCMVHSGRPHGLAVSWPRRLVVVGLFLLALAMKESAVVLPALLVIVDFAERRVQLTLRGFAEYADALLMPLLLLTVTLAAYLLVRFDVMGGMLIGTDAAPSMPYLREEYRVLNALRAFPEFLRLLFFPQELAADYQPAVLLPVTTVRPMVILGAVLLALLSVLALTTPWRPRLGFPAAWFLITIITVSNLFFPIGVLVAERTLYLPSIALSAMVAFAWHEGAVRASRRTRQLAPVVLIGALALLAARTWIRTPDWRSTIAVLQAHVRDHPHSYRSQWVLATTYQAAGDFERAEGHFRLAERIYPRDAQLLTEHGEFLLMRGRPREAAEVLERAHGIHPSVTHTALLLSQAYLASQQYDDALRTAIAVEDLGGDVGATMPIRAAAYAGTADYARAVAAWRITIARTESPGWHMFAFLARALALHGLSDEARAALNAARPLATDPGALALVEQTRRAVDDGCYDVTPDDTASRGGPPTPRACDPLAHWIGMMAAPRSPLIPSTQPQ